MIFDCDGVLVDSERLAIGIESEYITQLGWPLTPRDVTERFVGRTDRYLHREVERALGRAVPDFLEEYERRLHTSFLSELKPVDGVLDALDRLQLASCVASSGPHEKIRFTLGLTGLLPRFEGRIFSATEVAEGKPAPDLFLYAAAVCGVAPQRCTVVEDSASGVEAARAAGMRCLAYGGGVTPIEWLEGPGTVIFTDMAEIPALLES